MREYERTGIRAAEVNPADQVDRGKLQILVNTRLQNRPVADARVSVSYTEIRSRLLKNSGRTEAEEHRSWSCLLRLWNTVWSRG